MDCEVIPSAIGGRIHVPPSKSHTHRAILFASLAEGVSTIDNYLDSPDSDAMIYACRLLGAKITKRKNSLIIEGNSGQLTPPEDVIHVGNSGIALRFISALASLSSLPIVITGDASIRSQRPMDVLLRALTELGVHAVSTRHNGFAPLIIKGPIKNTKTKVFGADSQFVSALLILGAFSKTPIEFDVEEPGELPWVNLTLSWLDFLKVPYENKEFKMFRVGGGPKIKGFDYYVPGDMSSGAFSVTAAVIKGAQLSVEGLDFHDVQGDKLYFDILKKMGAKIEISAADRCIQVLPGSQLKGVTVSINECIDAICALAVAACYAEGVTIIKDATVARTKECDRIEALVNELTKMGAIIRATEDGLEITGAPLKGAEVSSHHDHRMAMALAVAGLGAKGPTFVHGMECIGKTYATFIEDFKAIGADFHEHHS